MPRPSEYWSEELANSAGKPDANLANDALHLGGINAEDFATKKYVQDYHNNKEELLKEYIDSQDLAKLQEAKNYVDTMIRNQDFSIFAKLEDLQSLRTELNARIEACGTNCDNKINTRIAALVSDVNDNFNDVNTAISGLNTRTNELFTSVSNGKGLVADAITDMGIHTSANDSYNTMATNIRALDIGGGSGEYDENFVNTSDGNATTNDIALGKIAYAKGQKIIGNHVDLNTSDATATEEDLVLGKSAYVDGEKIYGTLIPPTDYPTYGTDTTNANASSSDIALGKSAYVNGQYVTGTANSSSSPDVEEIKGLSTNDYVISDANIGLTQYPDSNKEVTERTCIAFSKDGKYCVSVANFNDFSNGNIPESEYSNDYVIESHRVNSSGLIIDASSGEGEGIVYKKYRYTKTELGLEDDEFVSSISIGAPGFLGYSTRCLLIIQTYTRTLQENSSYSYKYYLHVYTYHLNDNGVIGKEYNNSNYEVQGYREEITYAYNIVFSNTQPSVFFLLRTYYNNSTYYLYIRKCYVSYIADTNGNLTINFVFGTEVRYRSGASGFNGFDITLDDHYIYCCSGGWSVDDGFIITLDANLNPTSCFYNERGCGILTDTNQLLCCRAPRFFRLYNYSSGEWVLNKTISFNYQQDNTQYQQFQGNILITPDNSRVIAITSERHGGSDAYRTNTTLRVAVFNVSDILNANDGDVINPVQSSNLIFNGQNLTTVANLLNIRCNSNGSIIYLFSNSSVDFYFGTSLYYQKNYNAQMWTLETDTSQKLVGIRYKGQYFRNSQPQLLSATASDVASGKTFIGYNGIEETGTLSTTTQSTT